jgi:hypothetical protein
MFSYRRIVIASYSKSTSHLTVVTLNLLELQDQAQRDHGLGRPNLFRAAAYEKRPPARSRWPLHFHWTAFHVERGNQFKANHSIRTLI